MRLIKMRWVSVEYTATQPWQLRLYTNFPGQGTSLFCTLNFPATASRNVVRLQLPENTKTVLLDREFVPAANGDIVLYQVKWFVRPLGGAAGWVWFTDPDIPPTPEAWQTWEFPIEGTSDQFQTWQLPIPGTSDEFATESLGIDRSGTEWQWIEIPGGAS